MLLNFNGTDKPTPRMIEYARYLGIRGGALAAMTFNECADAIDKAKAEIALDGYDWEDADLYRATTCRGFCDE